MSLAPRVPRCTGHEADRKGQPRVSSHQSKGHSGLSCCPTSLPSPVFTQRAIASDRELGGGLLPTRLRQKPRGKPVLTHDRGDLTFSIDALKTRRKEINQCF